MLAATQIVAPVTPVTRVSLGRLLATPLVTIGVLSALLVWEIEHIGSVTLAVLVAAAAIATAALVTRRVGRQLAAISAQYESLLAGADQASRRAEEANRMKDEFLAMLSHELRTPLNSVLGWARLLGSGRLDADQSARAIAAIERAGWAQSRLIDDLLDISRIVSGKLQLNPRPTALQPAIEAAVRALQPAAQAKRISLAMQLSPAVPPIEADPDRVQQIVWNLVANAIKFTPADGHVEVTLREEDGLARITVSDSGIGFDRATAEHLFERFRQGDSSSTRAHGGLGLGLGIVRHLTELHGGTVSASSAGPGRGARFEVTLPMRTVPLEPTVASPAETPRLAGISVLVVDDDPSDLEMVRTSLEQYGAYVQTATSAREARERHRMERPDVLVSDLKLPDEDGWQLLQDIRAEEDREGRRTPAAAVSALARAEDRRRTIDAGYRMHVAKPVDPVELAAAIERLARDARR